MRTNKYPGNCTRCGHRVPANGGTIAKNGRRWTVTHIDCSTADVARVTHTRFYGGNGPGTYADVYQNSSGRCEDAPCCGCCS